MRTYIPFENNLEFTHVSREAQLACERSIDAEIDENVTVA